MKTCLVLAIVVVFLAVVVVTVGLVLDWEVPFLSMVTSTPTIPPTATVTATPTRTATEMPVPTETPTATPVPKYVGLPAAEVEVLRQECLAQNPYSLCLPLPFDPIAADLQWEFWEGVVAELILLDGVVADLDQVNAAMDAALAADPNFTFAAWNKEHVSFEEILTVQGYLVALVPKGVTVVSPWTSFVKYVRRNDAARDKAWELEFSSKGIEIGIQHTDGSLIIDEKVPTAFDFENSPYPWGKNIQTGETIAVVPPGDYFIGVSFSAIRPPRPDDPNGFYRDGLFESDLLRNDAGSIVYVLPKP